MCLATVQKESDNTVICKMVSRIDVEGENVILRDIMGEKISNKRENPHGGFGKQHCKAGLRMRFYRVTP